MVKQLSTATSRIWHDTVDPGLSETSIDQYNFWKNDSSFQLFICDNENIGSQVWTQIPSVPQMNDAIESAIDGLATVATTGSYNDLLDAPTYSQSSDIRSLDSVFQVSTTKFGFVFYSVDIECAATLAGGETGTVYLEICPNSDFLSGVQTLGSFTNGNTVSLAIAITVTQTNTANLSGGIPAGWYVRLRTDNVSGSPSFTYKYGQEILIG